MRSALTILGVIVAVSTIVSISMVMFGLQGEVTRLVNQLVGPSLIIGKRVGLPVVSPSVPEVPEFVTVIIEQIPGVEDTYPSVVFIADINGQFTTVEAVRRRGDFENLYSASIDKGSFDLTGDQSIILSQTLALQLNVQVADTIIVSPKKTFGTGVGRPFTVRGILKPLDIVEGYIGAVIRLDVSQQLLNREGYLSRVMVMLEDPGYTEYVKEEIQRMFPNVEIRTQEDVIATVNDLLGNVDVVMLALGSISSIVGGIGVMNTVLTSTYERTREIGILKAIGAEKAEILSIFLAEAFLMGLIGGVLGAFFGTLLTFALRVLISRMLLDLSIPIIISPEIYIIGILMALVLSEVAALYPAWKAASTRPAEALRFG